MAGRLSNVASKIMGGNGVVGRSSAASHRLRAVMGMLVGRHVVPDKPLPVNDELTWDNGTSLPDSVGKYEALAWLCGGLSCFTGWGLLAVWNDKASKTPFIGRLARLGLSRVRIVNRGYSTIVQSQTQTIKARSNPSEDQESSRNSEKNIDELEKYRISRNIPGKDRADFLAKTLINLGNSKEAVYGTLDSWVAWEENFPIAVIKRVLNVLEKEQEWHRIVQVIKWMLSKGQGTTMNTYGQLILALDMDNRSEEAHEFWDKRMNSNLHSVPWQLCRRMIAIYYRNKSFDRLVELFEELETFDRKPSERSIVNKVASAYELLGKVKEKERVLEKYNYLFKQETSPQKSRRRSSNKKK